MSKKNNSDNRDFLSGTSVLMGDATTPGVPLPEDLKDKLPEIFRTVRDFGCDFYPTVVQMLTYDEISEIAAYGGFPVRYPHWKFGMEYEEIQTGYVLGLSKIYEMVINTNPCYIYCMNSNSLVDNITVVAHALGHNDFFKNNIHFKPTSQNMMNQLANHGTRIRKIMHRWGAEKVTKFIDHCLRIETLIDPAKGWQPRKNKEKIIKDRRTYRHPNRIASTESDYMEDWLNPPKWIQGQQDKIDRKEAAEQLNIKDDQTKDVMGYLRDNAPLKPWQQDIISMIYNESLYFAPQRMTKVANEGFASWIDHNIMAGMGYTSMGQEQNGHGIVEYAKHKAGVLGGKYSTNPYKLGYSLLQDIEDRWNKGKFGDEWENCKNIQEKENWDKNLGLGREKVFEIRKYYNDFMLINEFFTEEFCNENEFFFWKRYPDGEYKIENRDWRSIKESLVQSKINGGLPIIRMVDSNHRGRGHLLLQHEWSGQILLQDYVIPVLQSIFAMWQQEVVLATCNSDGEEIVYIATGDKDSDVTLKTREQYESH